MVNRARLPLWVGCVETGLTLSDITGLVEVTEPWVSGLGFEKNGVGFEEVGGSGVRGLVESGVPSTVSIAAALTRSIETVSLRPACLQTGVDVG